MIFDIQHTNLKSLTLNETRHIVNKWRSELFIQFGLLLFKMIKTCEKAKEMWPRFVLNEIKELGTRVFSWCNG